MVNYLILAVYVLISSAPSPESSPRLRQPTSVSSFDHHADLTSFSPVEII